MDSVFRFDPQLDIPIYQQLVDRVRTAVKQGTLTNGQQLPTVQELAQMLGVARGTIKRAYDELEKDGFLYTVAGKGCYVAQGNTQVLREQHLLQLGMDMDAAGVTNQLCVHIRFL